MQYQTVAGSQWEADLNMYAIICNYKINPEVWGENNYLLKQMELWEITNSEESEDRNEKNPEKHKKHADCLHATVC